MKAEQLRKAILQMAIQGKLVPQDPNDEPASVLLERIKNEKDKLIKEGKIKKDKIDSYIFKGDDNRYYEKIGKESKDITDELPFEIPDSWVWCRLQNLISINGGYAFKSENYVSKEKGVRVLRISDFDESGFNNKRPVYHPYIESMKPFELEENDIIMCMTGGTVGKSYYVNNLPEKMVVNQRVADIKMTELINKQYVYLFLLSPFIQKIIKESKNSTNDNISIVLINSFLIPVPSLLEQKRIVNEINKFEHLLGEYDVLEQQSTKLDTEIYDKLKKSILQYAIQGKLVPQDENDEPASVLLERIRAEKKAKLGKKYVESYIYKGDDNCYYEKIAGKVANISDELPFNVPDTWVWERIWNISNSYIGLTYKPTDIVKENGFIVLRSSNILDGKLTLEDIVRVGLDVPKKLKVNKNDIIICARNGSKRLVGKSAIIDKDIPNLTFGAFMAICKTPFYRYVAKFLLSNCFFSQLAKVSSTTTINQLTQASFNSFLIPIPPLNEQNKIVYYLDEIFLKIRKDLA